MYIKKYKDFERIDEKWYHNLLAGLMLLAPSMSYANSNPNTIDNKEVAELSETEATNYIEKLIEFIKQNEKGYKNSKQMIFQLEKIMDKYEDGEFDQNTMVKLAKQFVEEAKDMKDPVIFVKDYERSGYEKIAEITTYDTLITQEQPSTIYIDLYEEAFFESGSYKMSKTNPLVQNVKDTVNAISQKGYGLENVIVESSTDGQGLSNNLSSSLEKDGYEGNNEGLSEARNDAMKNILVNMTQIEDGVVTQRIQWNEDSGENEALRYNKVVLKMTKKEAGKKDVEVKENVVTVYYKVMDSEAKHKVNINKSKKGKVKLKGNKKINLDPDRYQKCFSFK